MPLQSTVNKMQDGNPQRFLQRYTDWMGRKRNLISFKPPLEVTKLFNGKLPSSALRFITISITVFVAVRISAKNHLGVQNEETNSLLLGAEYLHNSFALLRPISQQCTVKSLLPADTIGHLIPE